MKNICNDVIKIINGYTCTNNFFVTGKENYLILELDDEKTVKFLKKNKYRKYIYSLIDNPKKQLILNIVQYCISYKEEERSIDFIFNEDENIDPQYLDILKNVYLYKFTYLSLNRDISTNFMDTRDKFNKEYLNFTSLDVNLLIESLLVNNVKYDIEHLLNNKNIKILSMCQTPDTLCYDDYKQYDLNQKLKTYSEKYSIYFEPIHNNDLIRILNKFITNPFEKIFSYIPTCNILPTCNTFPPSEPLEFGSWRDKSRKVGLLESINNNIKKKKNNKKNEDKFSSLNESLIKKDRVQRLINEEYNCLIDSFDNINLKNEDELPTLTESYIKQMNDEYYRDKRNKKKLK